MNALPALSLRQNFNWTLAGSLISAGCQWGMLVALARIGTPKMVGQFALALAITSPVILFANLNLRTVQVSDVRGEFQFGDYLGLRLIAVFLAILFVAGIVLASGYTRETALVIAMVTIAKVFDSLSDVIYGLLQQFERMDIIAVSRMLQGTLQLAALSAAVYVTGSVPWGAAAMALASATVTASYDAPVTAAMVTRKVPIGHSRLIYWTARLVVLRPRWTITALLALARLSLPLGIVAALGSLNANLPRYFVEHQLGQRELGVFSAMSYLMFAGGIVVGSLLQAASRRLAQAYTDDISAFKRLLFSLLALATANGMVGVFFACYFGRSFLTVLYGAEYADRPQAFVWLMVAAGLSYVATILGIGIAAARRFAVQLPIYVVMTLVTALTSAWLIPRHGLPGAAWAFSAGIAVWLAGFGVVIVRAVRVCERQQVAAVQTV